MCDVCERKKVLRLSFRTYAEPKARINIPVALLKASLASLAMLIFSGSGALTIRPTDASGRAIVFRIVLGSVDMIVSISNF
jgi:hypothetical protein